MEVELEGIMIFPNQIRVEKKKKNFEKYKREMNKMTLKVVFGTSANMYDK